MSSGQTEESEIRVGRDTEKGKRTTRSKTQDPAAQLETRVVLLEEKAGDTLILIENIETQMERNSGELGSLESHIYEKLGKLREIVDQVVRDSAEFKSLLDCELTVMRAQVQRLEATIERMGCKQGAGGVATGMAQSIVVTPRIETPKPMTYKGARDAKEVENYCWNMERYFRGVMLSEEAEKINLGSMYLADHALTWWRQKHSEIEAGTLTVNTWEQFKVELKKHFYPENHTDDARRQIRSLRQTGSIRDYIEAFLSLKLQVPHMHKEDLKFLFMDGLQNWAHMEVTRRNVRTLEEAVKEAESLADFHRDEPKRKEKAASQSEDSEEPPKPQGTNGGSHQRGQVQPETKSKGSSPTGGCFICKGPHRMNKCPKYGSLSSIQLVPTTSTSGDGEIVARMGCVQLVSSETEPGASRQWRLDKGKAAAD